MKALFFIILATSTYAQTANYALINGDGTVIEIMVSDPVNAATYPAADLKTFPDAVKCVPSGGAGMGWHYDSTTNTFTAPLAETIVDVSKAPPAFTLQEPAPVITTNNAVALPVVTTNNLSILTTNNSQ